MNNFKFCIHVTAPIISSINGDNLRGEPRWERNVLDACVSDGRQTHTTFDVWKSSSPMPTNLRNDYNPEWKDSSILITHGVPTDPNITREAKYYVVQYFDGPTEDNKEKFLKYDRQNPGSIVATCNFKAWTYIDRLNAILGKQNVEWIQGPAVPRVYEDFDNFKKPYLLWLYRNFWYCAENDPNGMKLLFNQIADYMKVQPELRIGIILGAWDRWAFEDRGTKESLTPWAWHYDFMRVLDQYKNRVDIHVHLDWHRVLDLISQSHLVFSPPEPLGGPPYEGAMFGVPVIVGASSSPFHDFHGSMLLPEALTSERNVDKRFLGLIDKLYTDHTFYRQRGDAYRDYVKRYATYGAYLKQIDALAIKRGWK